MDDLRKLGIGFKGLISRAVPRLIQHHHHAAAYVLEFLLPGQDLIGILLRNVSGRSIAALDRGRKSRIACKMIVATLKMPMADLNSVAAEVANRLGITTKMLYSCYGTLRTFVGIKPLIAKSWAKNS